jgi:hypothetical protein
MDRDLFWIFFWTLLLLLGVAIAGLIYMNEQNKSEYENCIDACSFAYNNNLEKECITECTKYFHKCGEIQNDSLGK